MFQGLSTALTALYADRQALETTGNNIANANTEGYSRQRVDQSEINGAYNSFFAQTSSVGLGVSVQDIARLRDQFIEARGVTEHGNQGNLQQMANTYSTVETAFGEPSDAALQTTLATFWNSWDDLGSAADDPAARAQVVEQAQTLVGNFQQISSSLKSQSDSTMTSLQGDVTQINSYAQGIADLNKAIQTATNSGDTPNALLDQRDLLVSKLSTLVGITTQPTSAGSVAVLMNGQALVRDDHVTNLQVDNTGTPTVLRWDADKNAATVTDGTIATVTSGTLAGLMTSFNTTIPKYQTAINNLANQLITQTNTQHHLGYDAYGNAGGDFFTGTDASNIGVSTAIAADSNLVAAGDGTGSADGSNAQAMANLAGLSTGVDSNYRQLINTLGNESQRAKNQVNIQTTITNSVDASRQSVSGVSLDEEMTNMVNYQKAYNSAAKYLSVMNDVLDTIINMVH